MSSRLIITNAPLSSGIPAREIGARVDFQHAVFPLHKEVFLKLSDLNHITEYYYKEESDAKVLSTLCQ
jgi:hypothetical protein